MLPLQAISTWWYALKLVRLLRLPNFLNLFDISKIHSLITKLYEDNTRDQQVETQYLLMYGYKIFRLLLLNLLFTYFLGLLLYIVSDSFNPSTAPYTFIGKYGLKKLHNYEVVIRCMYFILTTITTVGYGDFVPWSNAERIYMLLVELFGVAFFSYCMGNFTEIISSYYTKLGGSDKSAELQTWLTLLGRFNNRKPVDPVMTAQIESRFEYFWSHDRLESITPDVPYLKAIPRVVRRQLISHHLFSDLYYDFRWFFNVGYEFTSAFLYDMSFGFLPRRFDPGESLLAEGDDVEEIYLLRKGLVLSCSCDHS